MTAQRTATYYVLGLGLLWALIPTLTFPNPPLDVVEGFAWGREMALGYTKHPPMQAWLLEASFLLTGGHDFGAYWLSQISLTIGYACIWSLGRRLGLSPWQAFWSLVLTSVNFYFTLPAPEFNPNILQIPVWSGMMLLFHRALDKGRMTDWVLLGLVAAFGLYTKYFVALIIGCIGLYALAFPSARRVLATPGPWLAAAVCLLVFAPHLYWLAKTDFLTLDYAASRSRGAATVLDHLTNPANFLFAQIANHAGLFIVVAAGLGLGGLRHLFGQGTSPSGPRATSADDRFLLWFGFLPLAIVLLASAVTGNEFKQMWGTPMFVLSGTIAVRYLKLPERWNSCRNAAIAAGAIQAIFLSVILGQALLEPMWKTKHTRLHYPGSDIAAHLAGIWKAETGSSLSYVAGDMWPAANVTLHAEERPHMFYEHDPELSPWIDLKDVQRSGVLLVWQGAGQDIPAALSRWYPGLTAEGSRTFEAFSYGTIPPITINWAIIPAGAVAESPAK